MELQQPKARVLAYYLPQFHPIPENDKWWGKGFTEWTNVGKAKPLFPGHYQPHVPADLGYYDLRVPETREAQAQLAREYGIEGFVYWHYWFGNGKRVLERPFNEVLSSGKPDFPFALAWANHSWKGVWSGNGSDQTLIEQTYPGKEDHVEHFYSVLPAFRDCRYITCEAKPIFMIYDPDSFPDAQRFISLWRELALENGLKGIYFIAIQKRLFIREEIQQKLDERLGEGYDAINVKNVWPTNTSLYPWWNRVVRRLFFRNEKFRRIPDLRPYLPSLYCNPLDELETVFPSVAPNWDHTPRTGMNGIVLYGSTPEKFCAAVRQVVADIKDKPFDKRLLFVKSWNEWAEGNYLEPDLKWGHQYLEALRNALC